MTKLRLKCDKCGGPCWEEDLLDSDRFIDIVCVICGLRKFYPKKKYLDWKKKKIEYITANSGRALPT